MLQNFKRFIVFYALLTILLTIDQWFFGVISQIMAPQRRMFGFGYQGQTMLHELFLHLDAGQRLLGFCVESITIALLIGTLYTLYRIIQNLQTDQAFTKDTLDKMNQMTKFYLGYVIFYPFYGAAYSVITTMNNPPGQRVISLSFGTDNLNQIFIVCCLYIVFHVMKEACRVSSEYKMVI